MQVEEELAQFSSDRDSLLTIGVFDGVHLGHRYLISQLTELAGNQGLSTGVVTFFQNPREVLSTGNGLLYLTTPVEKAALLRGAGVDVVVTLSFTPELARLTARQFISLLKKNLRMRGIVVGPDFALGRGREGDVVALRVLGQEMDFGVTVVTSQITNGEVISSTAIRNALAKGDMKRVKGLLGRYYSFQGEVVSGAGRGTDLGFPTANVEIDPKKALPPEGVYVTRAIVNKRIYHSMTNIGQRLTFGENVRTIEVLLLDYSGDLYGYELKVDIVERLRDEKRFETVEELKKQIAADIEQGRKILKEQTRATDI